jgi:hypothetical protein
MSDLAARLQEAYAVRGESIEVGRALIDGQAVRDAVVRFPLKTANRHGLVAGATGTGKTTTLRTLAEQLSAAGVSVFATDVKGDLSGLAAKGDKGTWVEERLTSLGETFEPQAFPVEYYSLGGLGPGAPIRVTVSDFGPLLLRRSSTPTRHRSRASPCSSTTRTRKGCCSSISPTCGRCSSSSTRTRAALS